MPASQQRRQQSELDCEIQRIESRFAAEAREAGEEREREAGAKERRERESWHKRQPGMQVTLVPCSRGDGRENQTVAHAHRHWSERIEIRIDVFKAIVFRLLFVKFERHSSLFFSS